MISVDMLLIRRLISGVISCSYYSYYGRTDVLKILIQRSPRLEDEIYSNGYRPLYKAAEKGYVEVIRRVRIAIIDSGTEPDHAHMSKLDDYRDFIHDSM